MGFGAGFVKVGEVDAHPFLPAFLRYYDGVRQPFGVSNFSDGTCRLQLACLLDDEGLLLSGLPSCSLLHGAYVGAHP